MWNAVLLKNNWHSIFKFKMLTCWKTEIFQHTW